MGKQRILQTRKTKDIYAGFGISKEERDRACAVEHTIDINKKTAKNKEPRFTG